MTLLITKDEEEILVVTLSELSDQTQPVNWLFRFESDQTQQEYLVYLTDTSPAPERYNSFTFTEGVDVTFEETGDYKYEAYQMPDMIDTDYTRGLLVEVGKVRVIDTEVETPAYDATGNTNVYTPA